MLNINKVMSYWQNVPTRNRVTYLDCYYWC